MQQEFAHIDDVHRQTFLAALGIHVGGNGTDAVGALRKTLPDGDNMKGAISGSNRKPLSCIHFGDAERVFFFSFFFGLGGIAENEPMEVICKLKPY